MVMVSESAAALKGFLAHTSLAESARLMILRVALAFIGHRGRMSCSQAAVSVSSDTVHRGELTRFLARPARRKRAYNAQLRALLLAKEAKRGKFMFLIDATLVSQSGKKTQNTFSTSNRQRIGHRKKGARYNKRKIVYKKCHSFTFGLLLTPSGLRVPCQIPHYTPEYCGLQGLVQRTTAEAAAELIRTLPVPAGAEVVVIGDTAYEAKIVQEACAARGYTWVMPANPERVYQEPKSQRNGQRPKLRSRLQDWTSLSLQTIRLRASTGKYAGYRRLSQWRSGPTQQPRTYYVHQEKREVRRVGHVLLVFSTTKPNLTAATPDDVKILLTNATHLGSREVIELYSLRWQIELFFKELKSTLGLAQYRFQSFTAVESWIEAAITTVLFLEYLRAQRMQDRRLTDERREWWARQRLHGLCAAFRQECEGHELHYLAERLKTPGGIAKLKRLLTAATPKEFRCAT
jgi:hypothetical protein